MKVYKIKDNILILTLHKDEKVKAYMDIEDTLQWYETNYIMSNMLFFGEKGKKQYIGDKNNKICRFCNKTTDKTTFSLEAHAIPEFIGNHSLLTYEECDECNTYFSERLEDSFAKFLLPIRTTSQIRGKKGVPAYKSKDKKCRIEISNQMNITGSKEFCTIDEEKHFAKIITETQPYIPREVYRCLVKMALSILPQNELKVFIETLYWLRYKKSEDRFMNNEGYFAFMTFTSGPYPYPNTHHLFFKRKNDDLNVPYMSYMVAFGNISFQIALPCPQKDNGLSCSFIPFPTPYMMEENKNFPHHQTSIIRLDLSDSKKKISQWPISFHFDEIQK